MIISNEFLFLLVIKKRKQQTKNKLIEKDKKPVTTDPGRPSIHKIYFTKTKRIKLAKNPIVLLKKR